MDDSIDAVEVEFTRWRSYWLRHKVDSLLYIYVSSLEVLFQILPTGPVTTATNERSFSALCYLKTFLRFTAKKDHLNDLHC